jgi:hypothetical protein
MKNYVMKQLNQNQFDRKICIRNIINGRGNKKPKHKLKKRSNALYFDLLIIYY